jgi:hypothetical protein
MSITFRQIGKIGNQKPRRENDKKKDGGGQCRQRITFYDKVQVEGLGLQKEFKIRKENDQYETDKDDPKKCFNFTHFFSPCCYMVALILSKYGFKLL